MMISKKYTLWALNPLLLTMMAPAVAQQTDDETFVVSANRSNRTVAEMAQTTWVIENAELEQQIQGGKELKDALAQLIPGLDVSSRSRTNYGMNVRGRRWSCWLTACVSTLHVPTATTGLYRSFLISTILK